LTNAPAGSRAEIRASWIRRLHPERAFYSCHRDSIRNLRDGDHLDLCQPFGTDRSIDFKPSLSR
jgi:hypothetical protein